MEEIKTRRKIRIGKVISDKMDKTIVVQVERLKKHPLYSKIVRVRKKFVVHDENNECKVNDIVKIVETRPLSKTKRWRLLEILERNKEK